MKKKSIKILTAIMLIVMMLSAMLPVFASGTEILTPGEVEPSVDGTAREGIQNFGGQIVGTLQTVGTIVAVVILIVLGIKYMMGSAEEKAEYKKTMMPYLIGAVLIFAAVTIANIVYNFTSSFTQGA